MKKIIVLLAVMIMLVLTCVASEKVGICWDMCDFEAYSQWSVNGGEYNIEGGLYRVYSRSTDVQMVNPLADTDFNAFDYPYFAIVYKANTTFTGAALFFTNENYPSFSGDAVIKFGIKPTGKWESLVVDCREAEKIADTWKGKITSVRYDPINMSDESSDVFISRMGFFPDAESAEKFLSESVTVGDYSSETRINGDMQCIRVAGGVLEDGYDNDDYLCEFTDNIDYKKSVVMRNDNGTKTPVALSDVNSMGYVNAIFDRKGRYTVEENAKDFSDTLDHWAEEYIDYASSHGIFGGTSEREFSPDMPITRGMLVTVIGRLLGADASMYNDMPYTDVNPEEYYAPYISWMADKGMSDADGTLFRPEEAVKRGEMAYFISKALYGYDLKKGVATEFSDLDGVAQKYADAINDVSSSGIINGKGDGAFDPSGMLTRGEAATVMTRVIKAILRINPITPYSADYFTRDRIKIGTKGSFGAQNLENEYFLEAFRECGFDWVVAKPDISYGAHREKLLDFCDMNGIEVYLGDNAKMDPERVTAAYSYHPSYTGNYIYDEPGTDEMPEISSLANNYLAKTGKDPHVNLLPMYANAAQLKYGASAAAIEYYDPNPSLYYDYAKKWGEMADADFMCVDIYPLNKTGSYKDYVESINVFARAARDTHKEWYCYIQAYGWTSSKRNPTLRDFRWQIYSLLSFGCKGVIFWAYAPETQYYALVNDRGEPTEIYYAAKTAISEVKALSPVYCEYTNIGAFNFNCTDSTPYLKMTSPVEFPTIAELDCKNPVLVGCFERKDSSGKAFTLVNMTEPLHNTDISVRFRLDGSYTVTAYVKGTPQLLTPDSDGFYTVALETGEGAFVTVE